MMKNIVKGYLRLLVIAVCQMVAFAQLGRNETNLGEMECLRELPVEHLLKIRRALQMISSDEEMFGNDRFLMQKVDSLQEANGINNQSAITAQPLVGNFFR